MVKAGEHGGLLAEILDRLAGFLEASARLPQEDQVGHDLPGHRHFIAMAITTFLIVKVVPIFGEISRTRLEASGATQFLIDVSDFMRGEWYFLLGESGPSSSASEPSSARRRQTALDRWKLKLPCSAVDSQDLHVPVRRTFAHSSGAVFQSRSASTLWAARRVTTSSR